MTDKRAILAAVPIRNRNLVLEQNQDVKDIMRAITYFHKKWAKQYDQIAHHFDIGSEKTIARNLFNFCKKHINYVIQDEAKQTVSSPGRILTNGVGDCKHYASFIAGVLDALRRAGLDLEWDYRFSRYVNPWTGNVTNHVFVVLYDQDGREIWIDPVLNWFDYHLPYDSAITKTVETLPPGSRTSRSVQGIAGYGCARMGDAAGDQIAAALKSYELGLVNSYNNLINKGQTDSLITDILQGAAASNVPGASQALSYLAPGASVINSVFGQNSDIARFFSAVASLNPANIIKALSGRTYNTDSYLGAWDFFYHVAGINRGDSKGVNDDEVLPALKWWIQKLGIYISGRAHLGALRKSVDDYLNLYSVNKNTTQDRVRVQLARNVMLKYMPDNTVLGGYRNTVGVYDDPVTAAIERMRISDNAALNDTQGTVKTGLSTGLQANLGGNILPILLVVGGAFLLTRKN